jgi:peptidoglycan/LPS O-acetylase OafA/YrhL
MGLARVGFSFSVGLLFYQERARLAAIRIGPLAFWMAMGVIGLVAAANPHGQARMLFDLGFILVGCPLVLFVGVRGSVGATRLARLLGDISYPLYATHFALMLAIFSIHGALVHWRTNVIPLPIGVALVGVLIGLAWLLAGFVDGPVEERLRRSLGRTRRHFNGPASPLPSDDVSNG